VPTSAKLLAAPIWTLGGVRTERDVHENVTAASALSARERRLGPDHHQLNRERVSAAWRRRSRRLRRGAAHARETTRADGRA